MSIKCRLCQEVVLPKGYEVIRSTQAHMYGVCNDCINVMICRHRKQRANCTSCRAPLIEMLTTNGPQRLELS